MKSVNNRLDWIQALRGIAAFMVVLVHTRFALPATTEANGVAIYIFYPMAMGVDLFFIISGFLMVLTTRNFDGTVSYAWTFMAKRIARIWPVYAFVTLISIPISYGMGGFVDGSIVRHFTEGLFFIPHDPVHNHMYFSMAVDVAWTLCFEVYFYLVFTAAMAAKKYRYIAIASWFAITLIAIPVWMGSFSLDVTAQPAPIDAFRYANLALNPIIWDFVYGMLIAGIYLSPLRLPTFLVYLTSIVAIGALLMFWQDMGMKNFYGPNGWGAPVAIVFMAIAILSKNGEIRVPAWSVWLGGISYSLYLIHLPIFGLVDLGIKAMDMGADHALVAKIFIRPLVAIFVAYLMYVWIEMPLCKGMLRWLLSVRFVASSQRVELPVQPIPGDER